MKVLLITTIFLSFQFFYSTDAVARNYLYPQQHYQDAQSYSMGGVSVPITDSVIGNLMNNPAGLAKYGGVQAEMFNLMLDANSASLGNLGETTGSQLSLNSFKKTLNANPNQQYALGAGLTSAFAWHGLGFGLIVQERIRSASDGTTVHYDAVSETIPTVGIGIPLARGVVRLGYSFQYINQTSGVGSAASAASGIGYLDALKEGHAFSNNASVNFVFPFTYLPTISLMARNIFGLHYFGGSLLKRANSSTGAPADEPMVVDAALNYMIRVTGTMKTIWYFQFSDPFNTMKVPVMDRIHAGLEFMFNQSFGIRAGANGLQPSVGFGYKSDTSDINLAWYHEKNPLPIGDRYDARWMLQYTFKFKEKSTRDRSKEK